VKGQGHESQKYGQHGSLHSCEYWLILVLLGRLRFDSSEST